MDLKEGESNDRGNLSQQKSSSVRITGQIVVLHYNSGGKVCRIYWQAGVFPCLDGRQLTEGRRRD